MNHDRASGSAMVPTILLCPLHLLALFFFQAEDGIRDLTVTGVQTCALPILILVNLVQPGVGLDPALVKELLETYRAQAQGLQAGGGGKFGVDMFVNIVPSNPIRAAASLDMLGIIFFFLVFGAALTMLPQEKTQAMGRGLDALGEAIVKIIDFSIRLAPYS